MTALVYGIVHAADTSWTAGETTASLILGVALLAVFVGVERRVEQPIMPLRLFASRRRSGSYGARTLYLGVMISFWFFITQYLQVVKGYSAILTGVAFMPMTLANFFAALYIPRLTRRIGNPRVITIGIAVSVVGMIWLSRITPGSSYFLAFALAILTVVFAAAAGAGLAGTALLTHRINAALSAAAVLLAASLAVVVTSITVRRRKTAPRVGALAEEKQR